MTRPTEVPVSVRRRFAAIVALVGLAALTVFLVGVLFHTGVYLLLGLVGLLVAVAGGWWFVTEQMPRRAIGVWRGPFAARMPRRSAPR